MLKYCSHTLVVSRSCIPSSHLVKTNIFHMYLFTINKKIFKSVHIKKQIVKFQIRSLATYTMSVTANRQRTSRTGIALPIAQYERSLTVHHLYTST